VTRKGEKKVYKVLVGKPERKGSLVRPTRRWKNGIRIDVREIGGGGGCCYGVDLPDSGWVPVAGSCEHGDEP
jgi:hypothetical protein